MNMPRRASRLRRRSAGGESVEGATTAAGLSSATSAGGKTSGRAPIRPCVRSCSDPPINEDDSGCISSVHASFEATLPRAEAVLLRKAIPLGNAPGSLARQLDSDHRRRNTYLGSTAYAAVRAPGHQEDSRTLSRRSVVPRQLLCPSLGTLPRAVGPDHWQQGRTIRWHPPRAAVFAGAGAGRRTR